jgi:hypothetical protein
MGFANQQTQVVNITVYGKKHNAGLTWPGYMFLRLRPALCFDSLSILEYTLPLSWVLYINPLMQPHVFRDPVLCCLFQLVKQWPGNTLLDELAVVPTPCSVSSGASHQVWLLLQKSQCLQIQDIMIRILPYEYDTCWAYSLLSRLGFCWVQPGHDSSNSAPSWQIEKMVLGHKMLGPWFRQINFHLANCNKLPKGIIQI